MQRLPNPSEIENSASAANEPARQPRWDSESDPELGQAQNINSPDRAQTGTPPDMSLDMPTSEEPESASGSVALFFLREIMQVMLPALLLALVIHLFLAQATVVYGRSMEPNLFESQRLIIDKVSYRFHAPQRNDIVVLDLPDMDEMLVKRIVGLPGETVEIHSGNVYINDVQIPETFIDHDVQYELQPTTLPPLHYFVLGDNRGNSNDSRSFGPIHRESIVGRVWLRYWPLRQFLIF